MMAVTRSTAFCSSSNTQRASSIEPASPRDSKRLAISAVSSAPTAREAPLQRMTAAANSRGVAVATAERSVSNSVSHSPRYDVRSSVNNASLPAAVARAPFQSSDTGAAASMIAAATRRRPPSSWNRLYRLARPRSVVRQHESELLFQHADSNGFGHVLVHAGLQAPLAIALHGVCGHGDDRHVLAGFRLSLPNGLRGVESIHLRHLHIHQHHVERARSPAPATASSPLPTTVTAWPYR